MKSTPPLKTSSKSKSTQADCGLAKVKIDIVVFQMLKRKRRGGETIRMVVERAILELSRSRPASVAKQGKEAGANLPLKQSRRKK